MERPVTVQNFTTKGEDAGEVHSEEGVGAFLETGGLVVGKTVGLRNFLVAENQTIGAGSVRRRAVCVRGAGVWDTLKGRVTAK